MVIHHVPSYITRMFPMFLWHKTRSDKKIYLTFDDGPVEGVTDYVLDRLQERKLKASFFMVGDNISKNKSLAQRVVNEGHRVGNHSFSHLNGFQTATKAYIDDIDSCQRVIVDVLGLNTKLFRPPYGRITKKQFLEIKEFYRVIMWDVLSGDFDPNHSSEKCLTKTKKYCQNGSIIVFHDQLKTKNMMKQVLNPFLDFVAESGYETDLL